MVFTALSGRQAPQTGTRVYGHQLRRRYGIEYHGRGRAQGQKAAMNHRPFSGGPKMLTEREPGSHAVRALRRFLWETQKQFAERVGVTPLTIARWETNRPPRREALQRLYEIAASKHFPERNALCSIEAEAERRIVQQLAALKGRALQGKAQP